MYTRQFIVGVAALWAQLLLLPGRAEPLPPPLPLTLDQAIGKALTANPGLRAAQLEIAIAEGAALQAGARPNPELSLLREGVQGGVYSQTTQLSQTLELGGKRTARVGAAEQERLLAVARSDTARAELRADVAAAYLDTLAAQQGLQLAQASLELAAKATSASARRVAAGKISPVERTRATVAEANARLDQAQAEADLARARRRLAALWGGTMPDQPLAQPSALPPLPPLPELLARMDALPQLRHARLQIDSAAAQLRLEQAHRVGDLTVTVGTKRNAAPGDINQPGRNQTVVGLSLPLPLFDRNQGKELAALRRADKAGAELEAERIRVSLALSDAHQRASLAQSQLDTIGADIIPGAESAFNAAVTGFELGKFSFLDVLDAQRSVIQARSAYQRALSDHYRAYAELQRYLPNGTAP
jgi:cobalt-zinc-cadmium efflux system outer membrane protein